MYSKLLTHKTPVGTTSLRLRKYSNQKLAKYNEV